MMQVEPAREMKQVDERKADLVAEGEARGAGQAGQKAQGVGVLWWVVTVLVVAVGAVAAYLWSPLRMQVQFSLATTKPAATQASRVVPVVTAVARRGDMPIYLNGLGTVTALNTVTIHTRVDGQLIKVGFTEGQNVKEGDVLAELDSRPFEVMLTQAQGQLVKDEAALKNARLDVARYEAAGDAASQQQRDTALALVAQLIGSIKTDQGQMDSANLQLTYCRITAPLTGRIGFRMVDVGNIVHANDVNGLAVIATLQPITVVFSLSEDTLPQILKARQGGAELEVDAFDRDLKTRLAAGKLLALDNQIDTGTGTIKLKGIFENKDEALYPNQFVNARLLVDTRKAAVLVPAAAVQRSPQGIFIYVVKADSSVEFRPIKLGPMEGDDALVAEGLSAGETVVTDGVDKLVPGIKVSLRGGGGGKGGGGAGTRAGVEAAATTRSSR